LAQGLKETERSGIVFMLKRHNNISDGHISFLFDSGASDHLTNNENLLSNVCHLESPIKIAVAKSDEFIFATKKGSMELLTDTFTNVTLNDVLFCPDVSQNLISVKKKQDAGFTIVFHPGGVLVSKDKINVMDAHFIDNIPSVRFTIPKNVSSKINYNIWQ